MITLAIDPGNEESAFVLWDGEKILRAAKVENDDLIGMIESTETDFAADRLVIEMIASYGMPVGKSVFDTCLWIGKFLQAWPLLSEPRLVYRNEIKLHICKSPKANDATIRTALIDRLGPKGTARQPGPTFGLSGDMWSALAVAIYDHDTR